MSNDQKESVSETVRTDQEFDYQVGYQLSWLKLCLVLPFALLPIPVGLLLGYWFRHFALRLVAWKVSLQKAQFVVVKDLDGKHRVEIVRSARTLGGDNTSDKSEDSCDESVGILPRHLTVRYFEHRYIRYFYSEDLQRFLRLQQLEYGQTFDDLHAMSKGLSSDEQERLFVLNGKNLIDVPVKPIYALFVDEVLHPFYVFEFVTVAFWMADQYYYYSGCIILIQIISITISLIQTRREAKQLHDMVVFSNVVTVIRNGREIQGVSSVDLVPGDVIVVPQNGLKMPCDAVLVSGTAIVNESMLTGESVPVMKTTLPLGDEEYNHTKHKKYTLFGGTEVIQTRYYKGRKVLAVVVNTAFWTAKGGLVRSILFPKPLNIKLWKDSIKFVMALAVMGAVGVVYSLTVNLVHHYDIGETIFRSLDVITILVPPALPAALTVGTVYAIARLKKQKISCISPQRINLCGKVKLACFDKTGTLTEDSLDLLGVKRCVSVETLSKHKWSLNTDKQFIFSDFAQRPTDTLSVHDLFIHGMATCHSLTLINGELSGDPLDLKMFGATGWVLEEPGEVESSRYDIIVPCVVHPDAEEPPLELGVMKQFTFSSDLKRMSVLVRTLPVAEPNRTEVFVKGAPEVIKSLCRKDTLPENFDKTLSSFAKQGYRVLALGHKVIYVPWHKMESVSRDSVECDLQLLGLLVLQNRLKPETAPVIQELQDANIRTVMATGDNILTAVCVARECGMVANEDVVQLEACLDDPGKAVIKYHLLSEGGHGDMEWSRETGLPTGQDDVCNGDEHIRIDSNVCLAIDGASLDVVIKYEKSLIPKLLVSGKVFARVSPGQKQLLVEELQSIGYNTVMCGDGANDCGALKAAHAGISLSETEASIAAPFTSKLQNIQCVPKLLREGRASLVTSFSLFQFMALYCIAEFVTAATLYYIESNLGDFQYLFVDLILALAISFGMGYSGPSKMLSKRRPLGTLVGPLIISSLVIHALWVILFQLGVWFYMHYSLWFQPIIPDPDGDNILCYENGAMFLFSNFQYIILAVILSNGPPYRQPFYCNFYLMVAVGILLPVCIFLTLAPSSWLLVAPLKILQIKQSPSWKFRLFIIEFALLNFIVAYIIKVYVLEAQWYRKLLRIVRRKKTFKNKYKQILEELENDPNWPPRINALQ